MSSQSSESSNVNDVPLSRKRPTSVTALREEIKLIDLAAVEMDEHRSEFMVNASVERAIRILGPDTARRVLGKAA